MKASPLSVALFSVGLTLALTCTSVGPGDNPLDPDSPDYRSPSVTFDSGVLAPGDTITADSLDLEIAGNREENLFRWRLERSGDTTAWSSWTGRGSETHLIRLRAIDTGAQALHIQTAYDANDGEVGDTVVPFLRVAVPQIVDGSRSPISAVNGALCTLWVEASGSGPLTYRWYRDTTALPEHTGDTIVVPVLTLGDSVTYRCEVANAWGADTSTLVIHLGAGSVPAPSALSVVARTEQFIRLVWQGVDSVDAYRVYRSLAAEGPPAYLIEVSGDVTSLYTDAGDYHYWVTAVRGGEESGFSAPAYSGAEAVESIRFTADTILVTVDDGTDTVHALVGLLQRFADEPVRFALTGCDEGVSAADSGVAIDATALAPGDIWCAVTVAQGVSVDTAVLGITVRAVAPRAVMVNPGVRSFFVGEACTLAVVAEGSAPLSYQWLNHAQPIGGASSDTLILGDLTIADSGVYSCVVTNEAGIDTAEGKIRVAVRSAGTPAAPSDLVVSERTSNGITLSWTGSPGAQYYTVYRSTTLSFEAFDSVGATAELVWSSPEVGEYFYGVSAFDGVQESFMSNVVDGGSPNRAPRWVGDTVTVAARVGQALSISLADSCGDPDGDSLSFTLVSPVSGLTLTAEGALEADAIAAEGSIWATVEATDGALAARAVLHIQANQPNRAPQFRSPAMLVSLSEGASAEIVLVDSCTDPDGDSVGYTLLTAQPRLVELSPGRYRFTAGIRDSGQYAAAIQASDGELADTVSLVVQVAATYQSVSVSAEHGVVRVEPVSLDGRYRLGDTLTLAAEPEQGYRFDSWSGDLVGSLAEAELVVDADKSVSAVFVALGAEECRVPELGSSLNAFIKTVTAQGQGTICPEPGLYEAGTVEICGKVVIVIR